MQPDAGTTNRLRAPDAEVAARNDAQVNVRTDRWRSITRDGIAIWITGYASEDRIIDGLARLTTGSLTDDPTGADTAWLRDLSGHFAIIARIGSGVFAAVDHVRSIPLFYAARGRSWEIADHAPTLADRMELLPDEIDPEGAREIGLSGFVFGDRTLCPQVKSLQAGECVWLSCDQAARTSRYYTYRPVSQAAADTQLSRSLGDITLACLERLHEECAGREIIVPLSAGLDSRVIVSGLHHIGARNVRCFAYGRPGNFEANASQRIAEALGYRWTHVRTTAASQRRLFKSDRFKDLLSFADSETAVPFVQDIGPVGELKASGFAPADAVYVNGQTGDYLSGNHIPATLAKVDDTAPATPEQRRARIGDAVVAKHHALWPDLLTPETDRWLRARIWADIEAAGGSLDDPADDFGLFELSEWQNRQAKYVVAGQRTYEFFGHDWRLPLWEPDLMRFWQTAPVAAKYRQRLYRETLESANWGGVWGPSWTFPLSIRPRRLAAIRLACKLLVAPFGKARWHAFERRFLAWHQDVVANYAIVPWSRVAADPRAHRNAISWHVEAYLADKGVALDGARLNRPA